MHDFHHGIAIGILSIGNKVRFTPDNQIKIFGCLQKISAFLSVKALKIRETVTRLFSLLQCL